MYTPVGVQNMKNSLLNALAATLESVGSDDFYAAMCEYLRQCLEFDNVIAIVFVGTNIPHVAYSKVYGSNVFRYVAEQYLSGAYLLDPIYHFHLKRSEAGLYRLLDVAPDQFRSSRYYKWYYGRIGISDEISVFLPVSANATITISMGKDGLSGTSFSQRAENYLRQHQRVILATLKAPLGRIGCAGDSDRPGDVDYRELARRGTQASQYQSEPSASRGCPPDIAGTFVAVSCSSTWSEPTDGESLPQAALPEMWNFLPGGIILTDDAAP